MTKVDNFEMVSYKNGVYTLVNGEVTVEIDIELNTLWVTKNGRTYKTARYTKKYDYLKDLVKELESAETAEEVEEVEETCDLQDVVVNINESQIGRVVGMKDGKYRIVMSTGKLVELGRNEFYLDNEEPLSQPEETSIISVGHYNYEVFENEYVIRFTCKSLDRIFIYNKKYKDFKLMTLSTNRALLAKRYFNNYYSVISQLQNYILGA